MNYDLSTGQCFNAAAFVLLNRIVNENGQPIEFTQHKFLAKPYMDNTPRQVVRKAGQVGWSTLAILRAFHLANYYKANIIYTLPSKSIVKDFVTPKVDPLVENNPVLKAMVGDVDSMGLKKIGDRFVYFRSSWDEASGIAISADILISDELDRSNPKAIRTYRTRLDGSKITRPDLGWEWQFSNPTIPGAGVDERWELSDQKHWFIKCSRCNTRQYLEWPDNIDIEREVYVCKHCKRDLSEDDRIRGHWVKKYWGRETSGYWINQLMVPWHSAKKIIADSREDQSVFYNFTLGLPYQAKDMSVSRAQLLQCLVPDRNPQIFNAMGVDNGVIKHYVIGNKYGVFRMGWTESWDEIEFLRNQYNAVCVIDANPYPTKPKELAQKYRGLVYINYYEQDKKGMEIVRWGEGDDFGVVKSDRTKIIDNTVAKISAKELIFNMSGAESEWIEYCKHWGFMFRVVEETEKGMQVAVWKHPEGKPDHLAHATIYFEIALLKTLSYGSVVKPPSSKQDHMTLPILSGGESPTLDIKQIVADNKIKVQSWKAR
jgi:hypothetical protein